MSDGELDDLTVYVYGAEAAVRGVEMERARSAGNDRMFTDVWLHLQSPGTVETFKENISGVKHEDGLSGLMDALAARSMIPDWYAEGSSVPEGYDGS